MLVRHWFCVSRSRNGARYARYLATRRPPRSALPELPEVETVRRGLEPVLAGARLARVRANRPDLRFPLPDGFVCDS